MNKSLMKKNIGGNDLSVRLFENIQEKDKNFFNKFSLIQRKDILDHPTLGPLVKLVS